LGKSIKTFAVIIILALAILWLPHSTATISIRTHLFFTGHPLSALTSKIKKTDLYDEQYDRQYEVLQNIKDIGTGMSCSSLTVKRFFFLYFADYGEA
jgi:hypothetical protein